MRFKPEGLTSERVGRLAGVSRTVWPTCDVTGIPRAERSRSS